MPLFNETNRSFASLRMTWIRFVVILSEAKDLYIVFTNCVLLIPIIS